VTTAGVVTSVNAMNSPCTVPMAGIVTRAGVVTSASAIIRSGTVIRAGVVTRAIIVIRANIVIRTVTVTRVDIVTGAGIVNGAGLSLFGSICCLLLQGENVEDNNAAGFYKLMYTQTHVTGKGDNRLEIFCKVNDAGKFHYLNQHFLNR